MRSVRSSRRPYARYSNPVMPELDVPFLIKICGITNEEDARAAAHAGANALGFNFYPKSPRYIDLGRAREIAECVPAGVLSVGVFVNASEEELIEVSSEVPLDILLASRRFSAAAFGRFLPRLARHPSERTAGLFSIRISKPICSIRRRRSLAARAAHSTWDAGSRFSDAKDCRRRPGCG